MSQPLKITVLDFYVADKTDAVDGGVPTYGTPKVLGGAAQVQVAYSKNPLKVYESGRAVYNKTHIADATVTLGSHTVPLADKKDLFFGVEADVNGVYEEGGDTDTPKGVAIGWPVLLSDGKYLCTWFYDASASPNDENYQTENESGPQIEPDSIEFSCVRRAGDRLLRRTKVCATLADMQAFFAAVVPSGT
jgi:phi13 family phage major tail protein